MKIFYKLIWYSVLIGICGLFIVTYTMLEKASEQHVFNKYNTPSCSECGESYSSNECEKCGSNIMEYGILIGRQPETSLVAFNEYWSNYQDYRSDFRGYCWLVIAGITGLTCLHLILGRLFTHWFYGYAFGGDNGEKDNN